mmetsp:Transcript_80478/g.232560  ORF Transcript_80478/g.232560 Transcript_80478/m.232560 type:complete len:224 (-) Transcript_80478:166-837(-)
MSPPSGRLRDIGTRQAARVGCRPLPAGRRPFPWPCACWACQCSSSGASASCSSPSSRCSAARSGGRPPAPASSATAPSSSRTCRGRRRSTPSRLSRGTTRASRGAAHTTPSRPAEAPPRRPAVALSEDSGERASRGVFLAFHADALLGTAGTLRLGGVGAFSRDDAREPRNRRCDALSPSGDSPATPGHSGEGERLLFGACVATHAAALVGADLAACLLCFSL